MPELPDVEVYVECLRPRLVGRTLKGIRLGSPFVLRSVTPPPERVAGKQVQDVHRLGKRIVLGLDDDLFCVIHLMIAGRLQWKKPGANLARKLGLVAFDFDDGTLTLTEAGSRKRASLHLAAGRTELARHDPGGLEVLDADLAAFHAALARESHTVKRSLTDPHLFSGIGNAYSDEILHRARMSPFRLTDKMTKEEIARLFDASRTVLLEWTRRLRDEVGDGFPTKVTAFREEMAVHGRYGQPCPDCAMKVQRIVYADRESNYCATCQTDGRLLADRSISRLLRKDWPRTLEELETRRATLSPTEPEAAPPSPAPRTPRRRRR